MKPHDQQTMTIEELCTHYPGLKNRIREMQELAFTLQIPNQIIEEQYLNARRLCKEALHTRWTTFNILSDAERMLQESISWRKNWYKGIFQSVGIFIRSRSITVSPDWLRAVFKAAITLETILWQKSWSKELVDLDEMISDEVAPLDEKLETQKMSLTPLPTPLPIPSPSPSPFNQQTKLARIPTGAPAIGAAYGLMNKWKELQPGYPSYRYTFGNHQDQERYVESYLLDPKSKIQPPAILQGGPAWEIANRLGVMHAYIHLLLGSYAMKQQRPWKDEFVITGTSLMKALHLDSRRHYLTLSQHLAVLAQQCADISYIGMDIYWPQDDRKFTLLRSRVWQMDFEYYGHFKLYEPGAELTDFSIRVRPGSWANYFLNSESTKDRASLFQYGMLTEKILLLDPIRHKELARLALHVLFSARMRRYPNTDYTLPDILTVMFSEEELLEANDNRRLRSKMMGKLQQSLLLLKERLEFDVTFPDTFPKALLPQWKNEQDLVNEYSDRLTLPRNYWPELLEQTIDICPPIEVIQLLPAWKNKATEPPSLPKPTILSYEQIKAARIAAKLSIREMAKLVGRSKAWIQKVEAGNLTPSPEDITQIKVVLKL